jgi:transcriptional regulator with XRE-family HTH domain
MRKRGDDGPVVQPEGSKTEQDSRGGLAQFLQTRRKAMNVSYRVIAARAGVAPATVFKIEAGNLTRMPSNKTLQGLSTALGVPLEVLAEAAAADIGQKEYNLTEGKRQAVYVATEPLSDEALDAVLTMINHMKAPD